MRTSFLSLVLFTVAVPALARDVRVFIAPEIAVVPKSGKMSFDVYWINEGERPAAIPSLLRYSFTYSPLGPGSLAVAIESRAASHSSGDRRILPRSVVHDRLTADVPTEGTRLLEVAAEFRGDRATYRSNKVVLRIPR